MLTKGNSTRNRHALYRLFCLTWDLFDSTIEMPVAIFFLPVMGCYLEGSDESTFRPLSP